MWTIIIKILHQPVPGNTYNVEAASKWNVVMDDFEAPQVNMGDDAAQKFLDQVLAAATICRQHLDNKIPMKRLAQVQWRECNNTSNCSIWAKPFKSADKKFCDHDDLRDEYRGPAHNTCNLNYCIDPKKLKIPCIIHKLKGIMP